MTHCNFIKECIFFAMRDEGKEMREYLAGLYCAGDFNACARYKTALDVGQELVPDDLFPNENDFLSLFSWSKNSVNKRCGTAHPGWQPASAPKKTAASYDHLPPTRQTRSQH